MIVMKLGGTSAQDAQTIDRIVAIVRERLQLEIFSSPKFRPTTRQVSGHEFTRAAKTKNISGFSPCQETLHQGLKAKLLLPYTARLKSCPDTCLAPGRQMAFTPSRHSSLAVLRVSAPPRCALIG